MKLLYTLAMMLASQFAFSQIINSATAIISFDSSIEEQISGLEPQVDGSFDYVQDRNGNENRAIQLSAKLDYGNPLFSQMDTTDFTISFWFRKDGSLWQEKPVIIKKHINLDSFIYQTYGFFYNDWVGAGSMQIRFKPETDESELAAAMGPMSEEEWTHIAISLERSDSLRIFKNGIFLTARDASYLEGFNADIQEGSLMIGAPNMSLDDIYFFESALSDEEVFEVFTSELVLSNQSLSIKNEDLQAFPNPFVDKISLIHPNIDQWDRLFLYSNYGRQIYESKSTSDMSLLSDLAPGSYILTAEKNGRSFYKKVVKQ